MGSSTFYGMHSPKNHQAVELLREFMAEDLAEGVELGQLINAVAVARAGRR